MHPSVDKYTKQVITKDIVKGQDVLEVGSMNVNGSIRPHIMSLSPNSYIGLDFRSGPEVNLVLDIKDLPKEQYGKYGLVASAEALEHVEYWKKAIHKIKSATKEGGHIFITTRSSGFPIHGYPNDYWRFSLDDMKHIFSDCKILDLQTDWEQSGVFMLAQKPKNFKETDISNYEIESVKLK